MLVDSRSLSESLSKASDSILANTKTLHRLIFFRISYFSTSFPVLLILINGEYFIVALFLNVNVDVKTLMRAPRPQRATTYTISTATPTTAVAVH